MSLKLDSRDLASLKKTNMSMARLVPSAKLSKVDGKGNKKSLTAASVCSMHLKHLVHVLAEFPHRVHSLHGLLEPPATKGVIQLMKPHFFSTVMEMHARLLEQL